MKRIMLVLLIIITIPVTIFAGDLDDILMIRELCQKIDQKFDNGELLQVKIELITDRGEGTLQFSFFVNLKDGRLEKAEYNRGTESTFIYEEYFYYPDGELAFVSRRVTDLSNEQICEAERFYFLKNNLIRYISNEVIVNESISDELLKIAAKKIEEAKSLKKTYENTVAQDRWQLFLSAEVDVSEPEEPKLQEPIL